MSYNFSIIREPKQFAALEKDWDELVQNSWENHPFLRHAWFLNYYQSFYGSHPLSVLTATAESKLIAAAPMVLTHRRMGGIPLKEARLIAGDHSHVNILPVPRDREEILVSFLETILSEGADLIYLEDLKPGFPDIDWLDRFCQDRKLGLETRQVRSSLYIPTEGSFDDYRIRLSKNLRQNLNSRFNRIYRAGGYEIKTYSDGDSIELAIREAEEICQQSWQGVGGSGLFSTKANKQFYTQLIRHALEHRYGTLFVLHFEKQPAAFEFHLYHDEIEYCLKAAYAQKFEKVAPGAVLDIELVKRAFESPIKIYDLLGYDDQYKRRWTDQSVSYRRHFIFNRTAAGRAARLVYFKWGDKIRKIRRGLKQRAG